jgi:DNA-binding ferritin-like protein
MAEMNDSTTEKKSCVQRFLDLFKTKSKEVADKVEDKISDVKNSEFAEKVTETAQKVGEKAKDIVQDVKESEFAGKVAETAQKVGEKAKDIVQDVKESEFVDKVGDVAKDLAERAKKFGGKALEKLGNVAGIPILKNAGEKLRATPEDTTVKEDQLDELDKFVAVILEDGVITPEEEILLSQKAKELGLDAETFIAEVREKLTPKE